MSQDWVQRLAYSRGFLGSAGAVLPVLCHCIWGLLSERGPPGTMSWEVLKSRGGLPCAGAV